MPKNGDHRLRVLAIGRLTYYKGFEYLIRAASMTEDAVFHLVGSGELENSLKRLAAELGVLDRVTFHGKVACRAACRTIRPLRLRVFTLHRANRGIRTCSSGSHVFWQGDSH